MAFLKFNSSDDSPDPPPKPSTSEEKQIEGGTGMAQTDIKTLVATISEKTEEALNSIRELDNITDQIAAAAEESAGASEESLSAVTEIKQSSKMLEKETDQIVELVRDFQELFKISSENIYETSLGMNKTTESAVQIASKTQKLYQSGEKITDAVNLITKLSKKTSLLALNAAIEAARAKEKGKSFTIMAAEIRNMASKSNSYSNKIKDIVKTIQEKLNNIKETVLSYKEEMEKNSQNSSQLSKTMLELVKIMDDGISQSEQLLKVIERVVLEIEKLHQGSESIAAAAEEAAGATSEISSTVSQQVKTLEKIEKDSQKIRRMIENGEDLKGIEKEINELLISVERLETSTEQIVEAISQIEEAAQLSKGDAEKNAEVAAKCVEYITEGEKIISEMVDNFKKVKEEYDNIIKKLQEIKESSQKNTQISNNLKTELNFVKAKIHSLNNTIRKIELAIVQTAALSINGAVEALRVGELGDGFSEVSRDIRDLAVTSEENLDKVIEIIDQVNEENDIIMVEINNIFLTQERENEKLQKLEYEFERNRKSLEQMLLSVENLHRSIEEMKTALEQTKIAADQTAEAAELSLSNVSQSKENASSLLNLVREITTNIQISSSILKKLQKGV